MPRTDQVEPVPDVPTRDVAASDGAASPLHLMPTTPRQSPLSMPCVPFVSPMRSTPGSLQVVTPPSPPLQAELPMPVRQSLVSPQMSPSELSQTSSHFSLPDEGAEEEEGQFDDAEEGEIRDLPQLHPSEQPLPPSPSPSPMPSTSPSRVDQMVQRILSMKRPISGASTRDSSPDAVATAVSYLEAPLCPEDQGLDDANPVDTPIQGDSPSALRNSSPNNMQPMEPAPLKYIQLPPNAGRGTLIKQLFAPHRAFAAPRMVCPPPVPRESTKACTTPGPLSLLPLLRQSYIWPMTMDLGHLPSPLPVNTPIQAALDQVTSPQPRLSVFADQPIPKELTLPKLYSVPLPLPRTSPVTPILDEAPAESTPSPMDSEGNLPLNSIPVAELLNTYLPEDASLMPIIISGPSLKESGTAMKLLVSAPKLPRHRYGQSQNQ